MKSDGLKSPREIAYRRVLLMRYINTEIVRKVMEKVMETFAGCISNSKKVSLEDSKYLRRYFLNCALDDLQSVIDYYKSKPSPSDEIYFHHILCPRVRKKIKKNEK